MKNVMIFEKTKNKYLVLREAMMKNPVTKAWQDCVIYSQFEIYNDDGTYTRIPKSSRKTFVREKSDFISKFKKEEE